jgi:hypothetical protein
MPATALDDVDIAILDQSQLDAFTDVLGDPDSYDDLTILTDDDFTRGRVKFNLIVFCEDEYGIATQLHDPAEPTDTVLDFRRKAPNGFSDYVMGLA